MPTTLHAQPGRRLSPRSIVVPRQAAARAALSAAEQVTALRRLKRHLHAGMTLAEVRRTIDETIADIEAEAAARGAA
jgi:hypothetical protein